MRESARALAVLVCLIAFTAPTVGAKEGVCISALSRVFSDGSQVDLVMNDNRRVRGVVERLDTELQVLSFHRLRSTQVDEFNFSAIAEVRYRAYRRPKLKTMLFGLAAGALFGMAIGEANKVETRYNHDETSWSETVTGGLVGLVFGTVLSPLFPGTKTVVCRN